MYVGHKLGRTCEISILIDPDWKERLNIEQLILKRT